MATVVSWAIAPEADPPRGHRTRTWLTIGLAIVVVGLLIWGFASRSDLRDAQQQVQQLGARADQATHDAAQAAQHAPAAVAPAR